MVGRARTQTQALCSGLETLAVVSLPLLLNIGLLLIVSHSPVRYHKLDFMSSDSFPLNRGDIQNT